MSKRRYTKMIHEGKYVAEVEVEMIYTDEGWSPYLSLDDAYKLDVLDYPSASGYPSIISYSQPELLKTLFRL